MPANLFQLRDAALEEVLRIEQAKARAYVAEARALAALVALYPGDSSLLLELAGTARIGQQRAAGACDRATRLVELFPVALGLLESGAMFVGTAQLLLELTKHAAEPVQRELDRRLSARVAGLDAVDARALVAETVVEVEAELDREEQQRRYAKARANRGVWVKPVGDGMARVGVEVDAVAAQEFVLALEELDRAQALVDAQHGVTRTKAQRTADLLMDLPARQLALGEALRARRVDALLRDALSDAAGAATGPAAPGDGTGLAACDGSSSTGRTAEDLVMALLRLPVRRPRVLNVHVAASTVLGLDDRACLVEGLGALPGWMAQLLLPDAGIRRVLVDRATGLPLHLSDVLPPAVELDTSPEHGHGPPDDPPGPRHGPGNPPGAPPGTTPDPPVDTDTDTDATDRAVDRRLARAWRERRRLSAVLHDLAVPLGAEPRYAPSTRLRALVQTRDLRCVGPGCARTATACDLDHETEYAHGGLTVAWNLSAKSRRCHTARHDGWHAARDRATGVTTWTSPLGRVYTRLPAWRPLPALPDDVLLGAPAPQHPVTVESDYPDDRPLWPEPPADATSRPAPAAPVIAARSGGLGWDDGTPPPF